VHYEALLTNRQVEILICCDDQIVTVPRLWESFRQIQLDWEEPPISRESLYVSLCILERRGLVIRDDGYWPHQWTATDEGKEALEIAESTDVLKPSRKTA
jgi:hypothetical protein